MESINIELIALDDYLIIKNYSSATRKSYGSALKNFLEWRISNGLDKLDLEHLQARTYIIYRKKQGKKWQTVNGDYSALLKYFRYVKQLKWDFDMIPRPRKQRQLPRIISTQDVQKMIACAPNLKHQTFICLLYGTGMRLGEALNLKIQHIDGKRKQILIAKGKGAKDRYVDIPESVLRIMRQYYALYRPNIFLFNGRDKTKPLATRSAQHLIKEVSKRAGINKNVSPHTFRHSYATHHLENGTDLFYLQKQLGHKHLKTTAKYIHLVKEQSWRINHPIAEMKIIYNSRM